MTIRIATLSIAVCFAVSAQRTQTLTNQDLVLPRIQSYTVATLPTPASGNPLAIVTDAATAGSCTSGSGSARALCRWSGSAWVSVGDGGTTNASELSSGTIPAARLPYPGASDKGAILTTACTSGQYVTAYNTSGAPVCGTPAGGGGSTTGLYSGSIDYGSIPDGGCADSTIAATGVTTGKALAVALPVIATTGLAVSAFVSASDVITFRTCNFSGAAVDLASATYSARDVDSLGYFTGSATIDFSAIADGACSTSTITVSGAATGDNVAAGWPSALASGLVGTMSVSATDTVTARLCNWSGASVDPASATYSAAVTK